MSSKFKWITGTLLAAGLTLSGTTAAMAGVTPSPSYTPTPHPTPRAALWQFDFTGSNIDGLQLNDVRGVGPIPMSRWSETDNSPTTSTFTSPNHLNSVTLRHNRLPLPNINLNTCTATFDQVGNFRIINGTGTGAGFAVVPGTDNYLLRGLVSVDRIQRHARHHRLSNTVCPLQFVTPFQVRAALEANGPIAGQLPSLVDFDVQGNAQLVRVRPLPVPSPTGPGHFFAPTVTPNPDNAPAATPSA
jgi:hypothetical protein